MSQEGNLGSVRCRTLFYYPIKMPLNILRNGSANIRKTRLFHDFKWPKGRSDSGRISSLFA
jgi:hypothetical protein